MKRFTRKQKQHKKKVDKILKSFNVFSPKQLENYTDAEIIQIYSRLNRAASRTTRIKDL